MRRSRRVGSIAVLVALVVGSVMMRSTGTDAAFLAATGNVANDFSSIPDWKPPVVSRATVLKSEGGIPGYIRRSSSYWVVADVVDDPSSNPPAGIDTVQTDLSTLTTGATAVTMPATASTVGGLTYSHQSPLQSLGFKAAGTYANSITARDLVTPSNVSTPFPFSTVVDNTAPARVSATITNGSGATARRMTATDTIVYTWSETVDPNSVVAGWSGAAPTPVTVHVNNVGGSTGDTLLIQNSANTAQLPLGSIALRATDYVTAATNFGGPANATRSTLSWNGGASFTVTLGPPDTPGSVGTGTSTGTYVWTPQNAIYDRAGNLSTVTTYTEPGTADRDF